MSKVLDLVQPKVEKAVARAVFALPRPLRRLLAGSPIRIDGQELALDAQLLLKLQKLSGQTELSAPNPELARAAMRAMNEVISDPVPGVISAERRIPTDAGDLSARLYRPKELTETSPLLVFFHGGGWVIGDLDTHDDACRFLAKHAGIRVLSVDYRLAPEHPYPAAFEDCAAAYQFALNNAAELGTAPESIAVGGDSAGGNLAAAVALHATTSGLKKPAFQFLLYPAVDATTRRRSRDLFGNGFLLSDRDMDWFIDHYLPDVERRREPQLSVLLAEDFTGLPPAYVVTAGFDPLRDEGEEYARQLAKAGVPVISRRFEDLIHGFINMRPIGGRFQEAMCEIAGTLRAALLLQRTGQ
ncbi:MAG: alpha/beta hydrolase [Saccharopolyspora rectivirgula]|jgi:acetyl esterase|uniref:Alpha/beta hydrolase n=1 Tax=Saccharopolyspora rectivirgula TaxID=28042 RepID=A0A073AX97_9PSEU|nr:alpha/beta hydrolase [Saccharopolyspora rectivirgula]KEI43662.1 alpha/beta hydrolase [Saccharopolyspora rectivirgula]